jgi:uncharacterized Zn finger protein
MRDSDATAGAAHDPDGDATAGAAHDPDGDVVSEWWSREPTRPIRVAGGIRARSTRGSIGSSWWSRRFITVLESFALGTRLTRGRAYARAGQVLSLEITAGLIQATVQGSRPQPYQVRIGLPPFGPDTWQRLETELAGQAVHSAALLAGEVPPELEEAVTRCGASLFPAKLAELDLRCSCPDQVVPCKHLAATFYLLAESFDADPFGILRWRGRDRSELLTRLRELRAADGAPPKRTRRRKTSDVRTSRETAGPRWGAAAALDGVALPDHRVDAAPDEFWWSAVPLPPPVATPPVDADLVLRTLAEPAPALGGEALRGRLRELYLAFGAAGDQPAG